MLLYFKVYTQQYHKRNKLSGTFTWHSALFEFLYQIKKLIPSILKLTDDKYEINLILCMYVCRIEMSCGYSYHFDAIHVGYEAINEFIFFLNQLPF